MPPSWRTVRGWERATAVEGKEFEGRCLHPVREPACSPSCPSTWSRRNGSARHPPPEPKSTDRTGTRPNRQG
eukprot:592955-Rhodomonas_salina.1